jgi:hypothetical protein
MFWCGVRDFSAGGKFKIIYTVPSIRFKLVFFENIYLGILFNAWFQVPVPYLIVVTSVFFFLSTITSIVVL